MGRADLLAIDVRDFETRNLVPRIFWDAYSHVRCPIRHTFQPCSPELLGTNAPIMHKGCAVVVERGSTGHRSGLRAIAHNLHPRTKHQDGLLLLTPVLDEYPERKEASCGSLVSPYHVASVVWPSGNAHLSVIELVMCGVKRGRQRLETIRPRVSTGLRESR